MKNWKYGAENAAAGAVAGVVNHTAGKQILSEPMAFGLGGGPAFGYFIFEYKGMLPNLYIGTQKHWHQPGGIFSAVAKAFGLKCQMRTASTANAAHTRLMEALEKGEPVIAILDGRLFTGAEIDSTSHGEPVQAVITACGGEAVELDYLREEPWRVPMDRFREARDQMKREKYAFFEIAGEPDDSRLKKSVAAALAEHCRQPLHPAIPAKGAQSSLAFDGLDRLIDALRAGKGKKSWRSIGSSSEAFAALLRQLVGWISGPGVARGANRNHYAVFLREASSILESNSVGVVAGEFENSAADWSSLSRLAEESIVSLERSDTADVMAEFTAGAVVLLERIRRTEEKAFERLAESL